MTATIQILNQNETSIDKRAVVDATAVIGPGCRIGPLAVIGENVEIGANTIVESHGVIQGPTRMGMSNHIHPFACIGGPPQDKRYCGELTELVIGHDNVFRESVTINRGTVHGGGKTVIGDRNLFMAYSHIAHDCIVGSHAVLANHATVAGHTIIEDYVVFGGMAAVGTFLRIGESAMLAAGAMAEREVPPFCIVSGERARLRAINRVGMDRRCFSRETKLEIKAIFKALKGSSTPVAEIVDTLAKSVVSAPALRMLSFLDSISRGLIR